MSAHDSKHVYEVVTPTYTVMEIVIDNMGPTYDIKDWTSVEASSKREAVQIAVREWLNEKCLYNEANYVQSRKKDGLCPWTGIRAEILKCPHGVEMPVGFSDDFWCAQCEADWKTEVSYDI